MLSHSSLVLVQRRTNTVIAYARTFCNLVQKYFIMVHYTTGYSVFIKSIPKIMYFIWKVRFLLAYTSIVVH